MNSQAPFFGVSTVPAEVRLVGMWDLRTHLPRFPLLPSPSLYTPARGVVHSGSIVK